MTTVSITATGLCFAVRRRRRLIGILGYGGEKSPAQSCVLSSASATRRLVFTGVGKQPLQSPGVWDGTTVGVGTRVSPQSGTSMNTKRRMVLTLSGVIRSSLGARSGAARCRAVFRGFWVGPVRSLENREVPGGRIEIAILDEGGTGIIYRNVEV